MSYSTLLTFLPAIQTLTPDQPLTKHDLLRPSLHMSSENRLSMYYAPHNETINSSAKIVTAGITPGWQQMKTAFEAFTASYASQKTLETCMNDAKKAAGLAGAMRKHLTQMLDECGLPQALGIHESAELFSTDRHLLHTTSVIKYPVFYQDQNYSGHHPSVQQSELLQQFAYNIFPEELNQIQEPALVIPLGKAVDRIIDQLKQMDKLPEHYFLTGFPHPSGANGHRQKQFESERDHMAQTIKMWSDTL